MYNHCDRDSWQSVVPKGKNVDKKKSKKEEKRQNFFSILSGVTRKLLMMDRFVILGFEYTIVLFF